MRSIRMWPSGRPRLAPAICAASLLVASVAGAQTVPAQQPAPQQPAAPAAAPAPAAVDPGRKFTGQAGILFNVIKADKTADFEQFLGRVKEALERSSDPVRKQQAAGWKVYKAAEPDAKGNILYLYIVDPAVGGADYTVTKIIAEAFPTEAQAIYEKVKDAYAGQSIVNLQLVASFGGAAVAPAAPAAMPPGTGTVPPANPPKPPQP